MGRLEADHKGEPAVVQEVSRGVALGQDAANDAREQRPRRGPRDRQESLGQRLCHAVVLVADENDNKQAQQSSGGSVRRLLFCRIRMRACLFGVEHCTRHMTVEL